MAQTQDVAAFWCRVPSRGNVGDVLGPWLVRRVSGRHPRFARPAPGAEVLMLSGSVLEYARAGTVAWGCGILSRRDRVDPAARLLSVRGPLSREAVRRDGGSVELLGDAALVLPRLLPGAERREGVGVVPCWTEWHLFGGVRLPDGARLIDPCQGVEGFVAALTACRAVVASSLHALVIAHAYGVPALWADFGGFRHGDDVKYLDHFAALGDPHARCRPIIPGRLDVDAVLAHAELPPGDVDREALWAAFPLRAAAAAATEVAAC